MIKVKIDVPKFKRIRMDGGKVADAAGRRAARTIKARAKAGKQAGGTAMHPDLNDTGELINSIGYRRRRDGRAGGTVFATGKRKGRNNKRNAEIAAIQVAKNEGIDPFGEDKTVTDDMQKAADKEMAKQLSSGRMGLVHELRRIK